MSFFVLDTAGDRDLLGREALNVSMEVNRHSTQLHESSSTNAQELSNTHVSDDDDTEDDGDYFGLPPPSVNISKLIDSTLSHTQQTKRKTDETLEYMSDLVDAAAESRAQNQSHKYQKRIINMEHSDLDKLGDERQAHVNVQKAMSTCTLTNVEIMERCPFMTDKKQQKLNRLKRAETKGEAWYNLPATEMTDEVRNDLKILQMRSVLDPKRFYKKNDLKVLPKYFQIGTVLHSPLDHYSERDVRRNKKSTLVEELLKDEEFQKFNKRKYNELMAKREKYIRRKAAMKMKKLKKKK